MDPTTLYRIGSKQVDKVVTTCISASVKTEMDYLKVPCLEGSVQPSSIPYGATRVLFEALVVVDEREDRDG